LFINYLLKVVLLKQSLAAHRIHLLAGRRARTKLAAGQLSRLHHKRSLASKFADCKPNGLSRVWCNVEGLLQAQNKAENNRQSQGSASGYLWQPATKTDQQGCERLIKVSD